MEFSANSGWIYLFGGLVAVFVVLQSVFMLKKAWKRARSLGIDAKTLYKAARSSAVLAVIPSVPLLVVLMTLIRALGVPLPWIRLSVIGAYTYEAPAAAAVADTMGIAITAIKDTPMAFITAAWVMTLGILSGPVFILLGLKRYQNRLDRTLGRDQRWGRILVTGLFMGLISAFGGQYLSRLPKTLLGMVPRGAIVAFFALVTAAALMLLLRRISRWPRMAWLETFDLAAATLGAMLLALPYTAWIG